MATSWPQSPSVQKSPMSSKSQLFWYTRNGDVASVKRLLDSDPELISAHDYDGRTALHVAASFDRLDVARLLLTNNAPVNAQDRWGNSYWLTPYSTVHSIHALCLLQPLADAESEKYTEMAALLRQHGGHVLGNHALSKAVQPPVPRKCDWEIDPSEIDMVNGIIIGKGSFGEIRKTFWRGTPIAVKTILPSLSDDRLIVEDFQHEVELLVKLRHPNIVQFLGAVTVKKPLMLITEYLQLGDLHAYMRGKGSLSADVVVDFALDIARGMTYLHNGPNVIIHRDLKPRNVLLVDEHHLKVGDFGLSKLIHSKSVHDVYKLTGETGSYRYMAPEVFSHKAYDMKVDVFSFAMILYEMLEGVPPFSNTDPYEAAKAVAKGRRPELTKPCSNKMKDLIHKCWDGERGRRPPFKEILGMLEEIKEELPQNEPHTIHFLHHSHHSPKA